MSKSSEWVNVAEGITRRGEVYLARASWRGGPSESFPTLAQARKWRREATREGLAAQAQAAPVDASTVAEWVARFLTITCPTVSKGSAALYRAQARRYIVPALGELEVGKLTPSAVQAWVNGLARKLTPRTASLVLNLLARVLDVAVADGALASNPARSSVLKRPKVEQTRGYVAASPEVIEQVIARLPDRYRIVAHLALGAGLRMSEALGLRPADVDLKARTITVRHQYHRTTDGLEFEGPKWGSVRTIPVAPSLIMRLNAHAATYGLASDHGTYASGRHGRSLAGSDFTSAWARARHAARLDGAIAGVHALRHAFASYNLAAGVPAARVAAWMGHRDVSVTLRTYAHDVPDGGHAIDVLADSRTQTAHKTGTGGTLKGL